MESEKRYRALFEGINDPVVVFDYPEGRILDYNQAFVEFSGYPERGLREKRLADLIYPEDLALVLKKRDKRMSGEPVERLYEVRMFDWEGKVHFVEMTPHIYRQEGEKMGIEVVIRDITARKKAEEEILQRHKELVALNTVATAVLQTLELEEMYERALDAILEVVEIDIVGIYLVDSEREEAVLKAHRGFSEEYLKRARRIKRPRGATWWVINSGEVLITGDAQQDPRIGPAGKGLGFNSLLSIPI